MFLQTILGIFTSRRLLKSNRCDLSVISVKQILRKNQNISNPIIILYNFVVCPSSVSDYACGIFFGF